MTRYTKFSKWRKPKTPKLPDDEVATTTSPLYDSELATPVSTTDRKRRDLGTSISANAEDIMTKITEEWKRHRIHPTLFNLTSALDNDTTCLSTDYMPSTCRINPHSGVISLKVTRRDPPETHSPFSPKSTQAEVVFFIASVVVFLLALPAILFKLPHRLEGALTSSNFTLPSAPGYTVGYPAPTRALDQK